MRGQTDVTIDIVYYNALSLTMHKVVSSHHALTLPKNKCMFADNSAVCTCINGDYADSAQSFTMSSCKSRPFCICRSRFIGRSLDKAITQTAARQPSLHSQCYHETLTGHKAEASASVGIGQSAVNHLAQAVGQLM